MSLSAKLASVSQGMLSNISASAGASVLSAAAQKTAQRGDGSQVSAQGAMNANQMYDRIMQNAASNTAQSAAEAEKLRKWQEAQNQKAMDFNAAEAIKNRNWQEMMSNTAHQREVRDLMAAGLNPILSASGGNGASVGSGATASAVTSSGAKGDVDTSANSALVSILGSLLSMQSQLASSAMSAVSNQAIADKQTATSELVAHITGQYGVLNAQTAAAASRYSTDAQKWIAQNIASNPWQFGSQFLTGNKAHSIVGSAISSLPEDVKSTAKAAVDKVVSDSSDGKASVREIIQHVLGIKPSADAEAFFKKFLRK